MPEREPVTYEPHSGGSDGPQAAFLWPLPLATQARELVESMKHDAQRFVAVEETAHKTCFEGMEHTEKLMVIVACSQRPSACDAA